MTSKRALLTGLLGLGVVLLVVATQNWFILHLEPGAAVTEQVSVTGREAVPGLLPIGLAMIALAVTLMITGKTARYVLAAMTVIFAVLLAISNGLAAFGDDAQAVQLGAAALYEVTGLGSSDHIALVASVERSIWPALATVAAGLAAILGVFILSSHRHWKTGGRKYETAKTSRAVPVETDRITEWDALSDGEDPSASEFLEGTDPHHTADGSTEAGENR